jgi:hypothetical protein
VRLNPASLPDGYSLLYFYEWPDEGAISNRASIEINWLHDGYIFAKRYLDNPCLPDFWICHKDLTYC